MPGTVDRVVPEDGFGFIIGPNGEAYFFHRSALRGAEREEMRPGVGVVFEAHAAAGDRPDEHLRAIDVRSAPDAVPAVDNELLPPEKIGGWVAGLRPPSLPASPALAGDPAKAEIEPLDMGLESEAVRSPADGPRLRLGAFAGSRIPELEDRFLPSAMHTPRSPHAGYRKHGSLTAKAKPPIGRGICSMSFSRPIASPRPCAAGDMDGRYSSESAGRRPKPVRFAQRST